MTLFLALLIAYLLGSVSPSYLLGKILRGIDLREHGSGNVGATNAFRVLGKGPGAAVLLLDILKGWIAVTGIPKLWSGPFHLFHDSLLYPILIGGAVIAGHNWSLFLKFKGGKGVATGCGVFLALAPSISLFAFLIWAIVRHLTHKVSLGSLAAALSLPVLVLLLNRPISLFFFSLILTISTFYTHRLNIQEVFFSKNSKTR